jgi:hypothetical protein
MFHSVPTARSCLPSAFRPQFTDTAVPPPRASVASMPFNAHLQIPEDVWGGMGPLAQKTAATAGAQRALLARSLPLRELGKALPAAEASRLGITVLREVEGEVSLGLFTLPKLDDAVQDPPKSESVCAKPRRDAQLSSKTGLWRVVLCVATSPRAPHAHARPLCSL